MTIPAREAISGLLLLVLLAAALLIEPEAPGPGPLADAARVAALHAALLSPLLARGPAAWGFLPVLLALPALAATSYGHGGTPLLGSLLLVAFAAASGVAARALGPARTGLYGPTMILVFAMPYALSYATLQFGDAATADRWLSLSPWAAAASKGLPPLAALLALAAWPVYAIARRGR